MASATATAGSQTKIVMGHPVQAIPPSANFVIGNPQMTSLAEPSPAPIYLHQLFRQSGRRSRSYLLRRDQILLYRLTAAALVLFVAMACILFMLLLILRPHLPELQIASFTVSPLSTTDTNVSATCNVSILVTNPNNKLMAFYDSFRVSLQYRSDELLTDVQIPPFAQPGKSDTFLHIHLPIDNANVGKDAVMAIKEDLGHGWVISFEVKIFALIRLESKEWRARSQMVMFYCPDVMLGFSASNGSGYLLDRYKECEVAL